MTPPTFLSQPVAASSCGVQFQSPPRIQGPINPERVKAMESKRSRLHLAWTPPLAVHAEQVRGADMDATFAHGGDPLEAEVALGVEVLRRCHRCRFRHADEAADGDCRAR